MPHQAFGVAPGARIDVVGQVVIDAVNAIPIDPLESVVIGMGRRQVGKQPRSETKAEQEAV